MTTVYLQKSDWATELPSTSSKSTEKNGQVLKNSVGNPSSSISVVLPVATGLLIGVMVGGIVLGAIITLWVTTPSTATNTATDTSTVTILWNFNNNTNDQYNTYNALAVNTPTYAIGYTNLTNTALNINATLSQYVKIDAPYLNLTYKSFTVEIWFYPTVLTSSNYGLFGQCQTASMDLCLTYMIKNNRAYLGFYSDDQSGSTDLSVGKWYHVAFVYDYSTSTQLIYLDGVLEGTRISNPYKGMSGSILIGAIDNGAQYYFTGRIDQVSLITRVKTATEILNDATLVCYYSFDSNLYSDSGPLNQNGSGVNVAIAISSGRINDAISFASTPSYFVISGLTRLGILNHSYSISLWIKPTSLNGGTIIHVSRCNYNCSSFWCLAFIGLTSSGEIAIQSWRAVSGSNLVSLTGPVLSINTWTHIVQTYSLSNGMRLYVNGLLSNQSNTFSYSASNTPTYIYLGMFPLAVCVSANTIAMGQYYGLLDEFRLFSREITAAEVHTLANP